MSTWTSFLPDILSRIRSSDFVPDPLARLNTEVYLVPAPDCQALQFSIPVIIRTGIMDELSLTGSGASGAVHAMIEYCKEQSDRNPDLGALYGAETMYQSRYRINREPCTIISSPRSIATNLWRPDNQNFLCADGLHLQLRGAVPYREPVPSGREEITTRLLTYAEAVTDTVMRTPVRQIRQDAEAGLDQEKGRKMLPDLGLISFIGDGTRAARHHTRHRCWDRVAGPKEGVNIPFFCPEELEPAELYLAGSNRTVSGLGIRKGEVFAVTGSQSQGKTSLLQAIHAGEDDHAPGDGRELLVTTRGGCYGRLNKYRTERG